MSEGSHPFPSRTRKLSPPEPMVLRGKPRGRVGRCRIFLEYTPVLLASARTTGVLFCPLISPPAGARRLRCGASPNRDMSMPRYGGALSIVSRARRCHAAADPPAARRGAAERLRARLPRRGGAVVGLAPPREAEGDGAAPRGAPERVHLLPARDRPERRPLADDLARPGGAGRGGRPGPPRRAAPPAPRSPGPQRAAPRAGAVVVALGRRARLPAPPSRGGGLRLRHRGALGLDRPVGPPGLGGRPVGRGARRGPRPRQRPPASATSPSSKRTSRSCPSPRRASTWW